MEFDSKNHEVELTGEFLELKFFKKIMTKNIITTKAGFNNEPEVQTLEKTSNDRS